MSGNVAAFAIICGAALLAGWVDVRFPRLAPGTFMAAGLHMLASMLAVQVGMRALGSLARDTVTTMTGLFGIALPATIYLVLSAFWVVRLLHGMLGRAVR